MKLTKSIHTLLAVALPLGLLASTPASACTRCLRVFSDGTAIVARSMDWVEDPGSEIWVFPRGMKRSGNAIPTNLTGSKAIASVFSVIRNASAPLGITTPGKPNVASTIWRTVHDQKDRTLYFDSATSPTVFWVPLDKVDLTAGAPVKKLPLKGGETYSGDASARLQPAEPFRFLEAKPR